MQRNHKQWEQNKVSENEKNIDAIDEAVTSWCSRLSFI